MVIVRYIKQITRALGFDIVRYKKEKLSNRDLIEHDLKVFLSSHSKLSIIDVGANKGQSIDLFRRNFKHASIYSFEPSKKMYQFLINKYKDQSITKIFNFALGENIDEKEFLNFENNELSSFLSMSESESNPFRMAGILDKEIVSIITLDSFIQDNNIKEVDLLKVDTQGYDLEVLRGCRNALSGNRIRLILLEVNFLEMYDKQCSFFELYNFLKQYNFELVDFYDKTRPKKYIEWTNALFYNRSYLK